MPNFRALRDIWPFRFAEVNGISMAPTYLDGDLLLVRLFREPKVGIPLLTAVLVERDALPGILFIKRIQKSHGDAYWVEGDNRDPRVGELIQDSRNWGYLGSHEIKGKVIIRIRRSRK
jgi:signal peptidase I